MKYLRAFIILMFYPLFIKKDRKAKMIKKKNAKKADCQRQSV